MLAKLVVVALMVGQGTGGDLRELVKSMEINIPQGMRKAEGSRQECLWLLNFAEDQEVDGDRLPPGGMEISIDVVRLDRDLNTLIANENRGYQVISQQGPDRHRVGGRPASQIIREDDFQSVQEATITMYVLEGPDVYKISLRIGAKDPSRHNLERNFAAFLSRVRFK